MVDSLDSLSGPSLISWNLTRQCNLRCPHCYIDADSVPGEGELSEEDALGVVDQIAELSSGAMLIFSGGEPMLRRDLPILVRHASTLGLAPVLGTNGTLLDEAALEELVACGLAGIGVSLDSPDPRHHDAFRGMSGAWVRTMRAMNACRRLGLPFQVQTSLTKENLPYLRKMVELSSQLGAGAFNLFFLVCTGRGESLTDITPEEYEQALVTLARLQEGFPAIKVRARCAPQFSRIMAEQGDPSADAPAGCMAGNTYLRLSPEGKVTPCPYLPIVVGDLRQQGLARIWQGSLVLKDLRAGKWQGRCGVCPFSVSCRGCRARAYVASDNYLGEDPWCTYEPANTSDACPASGLLWHDEARRRMERAPAFIRERVMAHIETYARQQGYREVTVEILDEVKSNRPTSGLHFPFRH